MKKVNILIVEDESLIAEELKRIVQRLGHTVIAIANRYNEAIDLLKEKTPDLVLLDIGLNYSDNDGVDLANYINNTLKVPFIYITANADALTVNRAKGTKPASFILKPFNEQSIYANLEIVLFNQTSPGTITIRHAGKNVIVELSKIRFIKAENMYTDIYTSDHKKYTIRKFMKHVFEELNSDQFIQVHRSFIVNKKFIVSYIRNYVFIGEEKIPVGDSYKEILGS